MSAHNNRVNKMRLMAHRLIMQKMKTILMTKRKKMTATMKKTMMRRASLAQMRTKKKKMPHITT